MGRKRRAAVGVVLAVSLAQGLVYPAMAYGVESEVPEPITDSSVTYNEDGSVRSQDTRPAQDTQPTQNAGGTSSGDADAAVPEDNAGRDEATEPEPSDAPASADTGAGEQETDRDAQDVQGTEDAAPSVELESAAPQESPRAEESRAAAGVQPPDEHYTGRVEYQGATYYFRNGQMVKDAEVCEAGNWYMYGADGKMVKGKEIAIRVASGGTKLVRYGADGKMVKGVYTENGKRYFYDKVNGRRVSGVWKMLNEDGQGTRWVYYSTSNGAMQFGEQYLNYDREHTGWYHFDERTGAMAHGVKHVKSSGGKWVYYHTKSGKMRYGEQYLNYDREHTGWYHFDERTGAMAHGVKHVKSSGGKWVYYHTKSGKMRYGEQYLNYDREHTGWYYFDTRTGKMAHGFTWLPASGKDAAKTVYYHAQSGKMQYGGQLINNRPYYFDKHTGRKYSGNEVVNTIVRTARNYRRSNLNSSGSLVSAGGIFCPKGPCMSFVWCVYHYSGMDVFLANGTSAAGRPSGYPDDYYDWYARNGRLTHTPRVGDVAFFYFSSGAGWARNASHAALVVGVNGNRITVIDDAFYSIDERIASNSGGTYPMPKAYGHPDFH